MTIDMTFEAREEIIKRNAHERGREEMLVTLVKEGLLDISTAAKKAGMKVEDFEKLLTL